MIFYAFMLLFWNVWHDKPGKNPPSTIPLWSYRWSSSSFKSQSRSVIWETIGKSPVDLEMLTCQMGGKRKGKKKADRQHVKVMRQAKPLWRGDNVTPLEGCGRRAALLRTPQLMDLLNRRNLCRRSESLNVATFSHSFTRWYKVLSQFRHRQRL